MLIKKVFKEKMLRIRTYSGFFIIFFLIAGVQEGFAFNVDQLNGILKQKIRTYCALELENSRYMADLLASPTVFSRTLLGPELSNGNPETDSFRITSKIGLKYRLSDLIESNLIREYAKAECQQFKYNLLKESYLTAFYPISEVNALNAKRIVITTYLEELRLDVKTIEKKLRVRNTTVRQLFDWQQVVFKLEQQSIEIDNMLEQLAKELADGYIYSNFSVINDAGIRNIIDESERWELKAISTKRQLTQPRKWDVGFSGGYLYRDVENPINVPAFFEINVEYKLGHILRKPYSVNKVSSNYVSVNTSDIIAKIHDKRINEILDAHSYSRQFELLKLRRKKVERQNSILLNFGNNDYDGLSQKLLLEKIYIDADFAYYESKLNSSLALSKNEKHYTNTELAGYYDNIPDKTINPFRKTKQTIGQGFGLRVSSPAAISVSQSNVGQQLYVTNGSVLLADDEQSLLTQSKTLRARSKKRGSQFVELKFSVSSRIDDAVVLASGEVRYQVGVFMLAENQCNLLYAMLRIKKNEIRVNVQKKINSGQSMHSECEANGYQTLRPDFTESIERLDYNKMYDFNAVFEKRQLSLFLNKRLVWQGVIDLKNLPKMGYAGVRADNLNLEFQFKER